MNKHRGVIVPVITPLTADGRLDHTGFAELLEMQIRAGVDGVFVAGTTGESLALPPAVRRDAIETACGIVAQRLQVMAGIGACNLDEVLDHAEVATRAGADACVLHPPPYFQMNDEDIAAFFTAVVDQTALPLLLYNIPSCTGNSIAPEVVKALAQHERIVGIKDSSGKLDYYGTISRSCRSDDFTVLMGEQTLVVEACRIGCDGIVPSLGNVHPELCVQCFRMSADGNWEQAMVTQREISELTRESLKGGSWLEMLRWIKHQLHVKGICEEYLAPMFVRQVSYSAG